MTAKVPGFSAPDEGRLVAVDVEGAVVAVTVLDGELYAFDDTCPHAGCSLSEGDLDGSVVTCPCHFSTFDVRTGAVLDGPAVTGVSTRPARVTDGQLEMDEPRDPAEQASAEAAQPSGSPRDTDIAMLIEREHDAFRRQFEALDRSADPAGDWTKLAELLEVHARAEETVLYPLLVRAAHDATAETEHAVRDHNEIREAVDEVARQQVDSENWWEAVRAAKRATEDHLQEEERELLPVVRETLDAARRQGLVEQWVAFSEEHAGGRGLSGDPVDPQDVVTVEA